MYQNPDNKKRSLEDAVEMLLYSIDNMERQIATYPEGSLERLYALKILESCRAQLDERRKELDGLH